MSLKRTVLLIVVLLCINMSSSASITLTSVEGSNSLRSFHETFLSASTDGTVSLSYNILNWEKWKWVWIENKDYVWMSYHGTYLSANQDGTVTLAKQPKESER